MTKLKEKIEEFVLIHNFMGASYTTKEYAATLSYDTEWNNLMPVCREILSKNDDEGLEYALSNGHSASEVYKQAIRFIKERNEIIKKSKDLGIKCK